MTSTKNNTDGDIRENLSYFTLTLQSYLNESFPELASDNEFIKERSDLAAQTYANAVAIGYTHVEAQEQASAILYNGLGLSKFDTLFKVVCNEFDMQMADEELRPFALKMYPFCLEIFDNYPIQEEDFIDSPAYDLLYTELTGTIVLYIEENGVW